MKLTFSILAVFAATLAFTQEYSQADVELQTKYANSVLPYIFADGSIQLTVDGYVYNFDQGARLQGSPIELAETPKKEVVPGWSTFDEETESVIYYGSGVNTRIFVTEELSAAGKTHDRFEFPDELDTKRNLCSFIKNDKSPQCVYAHQAENGTLYGVEIYMSISDKSHPDRKKMDDDVFHTFLHLVRYNPVTKEAAITNHLIDKISFPRGGRNSANVRIAGMIGNKLIVVYETYESEEAKGMYDAMGSSRNKKMTFWSLDIETKEEKQLYEYDVNFPAKAAAYKISFDALKKSGTLIMDCSWTEGMDVMIDGKKETGYSSHHKLLTLAPDMKFSETTIEVPTDILLLANSSPARFDYDVAADGTLRYCNIIRSTEEAEKRKDNKDHYVVYMYQVDESGELSQTYNFARPGVGSVDGLRIFTAKNFEEQTLEEMYTNIFDPEEVCRLCNPRIKHIARIVDGDLITMTIQWLPEHTCNAGRCEIKKMMVRVGRVPLSE